MLPFVVPALVSIATPALAGDSLPAGIWTNTEDAYFAEEEGRERPEPIMIEVGNDGKWRRIDAFGTAEGAWIETPVPGLARRASGSGWEVSGSEIRIARPFSCWVSVRKFAAKPDGAPDWTFTRGLATFDQGGRIRVGGGDAPEAVIRLRNVTWAKGSSNKPSLVLYVHTDDPQSAVSYSWAADDSRSVGINLRWIQGSCSLADTPGEPATLVAAGERWRTLYEAGDWATLRSLYEDDAVLMTAGQPALHGADAIVAYLRRVSDNGGQATFRFEPEEAVVEGDLGTVTAKYRMDIAFPGRDPVAVAGRSLLIYKWRDGDWRLWRDMDNQTPDVTPETLRAR